MPETIITADQLMKVCNRITPARAEVLVSLFNTVCPLYGINSKDIFHEFLANLAEESGEFTHYEENLKYSAKRLVAVWPKRFPSLEAAQPYEFNEKTLAEKVYGMRKDLGNNLPGDGWAFRGSGMIQLTGRGNMTNFGNWMDLKFGIKKTPEEWAELLRTNDEYSLHSACWIFAISKKLIDEAERDEMTEIVKRINGGLTNYSSRLKYYSRAKAYIV